MDLNVLKENFKSNGKELKDKNRHSISPEKFKSICAANDIFILKVDLEEEYNNAIKILHNNGFDLLETIKENLDKSEVFRGFKAKGCKGVDSIIYYSESSERSFCLGSSKDLDSRTMYKLMVGDPLYHPILTKWRLILKPYCSDLKISSIDTEMVVEFIWKRIFNAAVDMEQEEIDFSMPPAILEGFGRGTEYTIPFKLQESTLDQLHPILKNFLIRMEDHEFFCAILAAKLVGKSKHYVPWLYGKGGDGKSSFIRFLNYIIPKGSVELNFADKSNGLWEALGKTFLIVPDTGNKNIFYYEEVKKITGGDAVVINGKYKHARTEKLPGMIIVSSNKLPNIGSDEFAKRRARVFKISKGDFSGTAKELSVEVAAKEMASTSNEFLNYCLQCLKKLGNIETGQVPSPPSSKTNQSKTLEEYEYLDFIEDNSLILSENSSIEGIALRKLVKKERIKNDYFLEGFLDYLGNHCKVITNGTTYIGIGKKNQHIVNNLTKELQNALPK